MADLTPEQAERLAEAQKRFNEEALKGERILESLSKILGDEVKNLKDSAENARKLNTALGQGKDINKQLNSEILKSGQKIEELEFQRSKNLAKLAKARKKEDIDALLDANRKIDTQLKIENLIRGQLELLEQHVAEEKKISEQRKKESDLLENIAKSLEKNIGITRNQVKEMFTLTGLFTLLIDSAFKADQQATDLAKSLGLSKGAAMDVRQEFVEYSRASKNAFVNTDRLLKAQQGLTEQLGIAVKFSGEEAEQFARLTEIVGLSNEEAGKLAQFSAATGKDTKDYVADLRKGAFSAMQANKIHISDKELLSSISKLSSGILVKFQNNPKALSEAVVQAKKLGLNLEQVDSIGKSMLDWESSIENELEAELITGKKLNFERARAAALTGDQATLMQEVASQAGSLAEFQDMNVIAQESLAKAFGMNADQMAEMLMKQEAINKYGDKAAELNAEQIKDMEKRNMSVDQYLEMQSKQQSAQEQFNNAMMKLQEIIGNLVAGPLGKALDLIASITQYSEVLNGLISFYIGRQVYLMTLKVAEFALTKKKAKANAADASIELGKQAGKVPVVGAVLGVAAAIAAFAAFSGLLSKGDDVISPGYGKRMIFSPEGAVALNDKDTVVAGTNLGGKKDSNTGLVRAIASLANTVATQKPSTNSGGGGGNIYLDGERVGTMVGRRTETGTEQVKNTYRLA